MNERLIAFTGLKGSGKDTAAEALGQEFVNIKMAGALKHMLRSLLEYQGARSSIIHRMLEGDLKEVPTGFFGGRTPRHAMQTIGTEWGRRLMADDIWIKITENVVAQHPFVVISDIRFPNEIDMVRRLGGQVYRVERGSTPADLHESEVHIPNLQVDGIIRNDQDRGHLRQLIKDRFSV